jgi:hypothetical protein
MPATESCEAKAVRKHSGGLERRPEHGGTGYRSGAQVRWRRKGKPGWTDPRSRAARKRTCDGWERTRRADHRLGSRASGGTVEGSIGKSIPRGSSSPFAAGLKRAARGRRRASGPSGNARSSASSDRREARMPLPARVEHAAETRPCDPSGSNGRSPVTWGLAEMPAPFCVWAPGRRNPRPFSSYIWISDRSFAAR